MLDEARYFLGKSAVIKVLDWMALLKLNKFHWHLTEDQGWRIQIDKYPKLTEIGSKRNGTPLYRNENKELDGKEHSGFYTKEDIKEIVEYAKHRYIDIIPEVEMPGHSVAALTAYPELSCKGGPFEVSNYWGVHKDVFCLGNPQTNTFLKNILQEVMDLFPYEYIHTGGDEVPKDRWSNCPKCQEKIKNEKINDEHGLQVNFTNEITEFLANKGRKNVVWNELTDERLDSRTVIQFWRGSFESIFCFLEKGGSAIISPSNYYYVDVAYHKTSLKKAYNYEPLPSSLETKIGKNIIGIEAELWGEVFNSQEKMEYCAFPRVFAIAESAWTRSNNKDYPRFIKSVEYFERLWKKLGINFTHLKITEPSWFDTLKNRFKKGFGHYI
jgi:hexosaminidase